MLNTRRESLKLLGKEFFSLYQVLVKAILCLLAAGIIYFAVGDQLPSEAARRTLFILIFSGLMWMTEAIPAFAVSLTLIALEIFLLGYPGAEGSLDWQIFTAPWSSSLIWLFLGGLILAAACTKTGLDTAISSKVLLACGQSNRSILIAVMGLTFAFSMFMSNTATAAMMISVTTPILTQLPMQHPLRKNLLLSVPIAANIGGMATLIGTPPNAIAAGALQSRGYPIDFASWMLIGLPPAILILLCFYWKLAYDCRGSETADFQEALKNNGNSSKGLSWHRKAVGFTFILTVSLWMSQPLHHLPTAVTAFLPITLLTLLGIIDSHDIRQLPWDVLILLSGGLSLGVAVKETGLGEWLISQFPFSSLPLLLITFALTFISCLLSNFMSNTAAANILIPIAIVMIPGQEQQMAIPLALGASAAMALPISTPPNALAFASGHLQSKDFLQPGIIALILSSIIVPLWCFFIF